MLFSRQLFFFKLDSGKLLSPDQKRHIFTHDTLKSTSCSSWAFTSTTPLTPSFTQEQHWGRSKVASFADGLRKVCSMPHGHGSIEDAELRQPRTYFRQIISHPKELGFTNSSRRDSTVSFQNSLAAPIRWWQQQLPLRGSSLGHLPLTTLLKYTRKQGVKSSPVEVPHYVWFWSIELNMDNTVIKSNNYK